MPALKGGVPWNKGHPWSNEVKKKISESRKGIIPWNKGISRSDCVKKKISDTKMGVPSPIKGISSGTKGIKRGPSPLRGRKLSDETKQKMSLSKMGEKHPHWNGGKKLAIARHRNKRRAKGFILIAKGNPYDEEIHYHHIHPNLPYVVPCPARIHTMFFGADRSHFNNVNQMIGIKVPEELEAQARIAITAPETKEEIQDAEYEFYPEIGKEESA